jgi:hypothetical protein
MGNVLVVQKDGQCEVVFAYQLGGPLFHVLYIDYEDTNIPTV